MGCYVKSSGQYYEGDREHVLDQEVPKRPTAQHIATFNGGGLFASWQLDSQAQSQADRLATDAAEAEQLKIDAQIQADLNMTPTDVNTTVDSVFSGWTAAQRTFMKRLVRMVLAVARRVLR